MKRIIQIWALEILLWATPEDDLETIAALHRLSLAILSDDAGRR